MHRLISPKAHGYLDYMVDIVFFLAPSLFGFSQTAATLSYVVAGLHLIMNLVTRYPMGVVKWLSFPVHGTLELIASIVLLIAPNLFGFTDDGNATAFYRISGVAIFGVWAATNYRAVTAGVEARRTTMRAA